MKQQRRFTKEFEEEAVRLVQTSGRTQREIAGDLGIGLSTLVRWLGRSRDRRAAAPAMAAANDVTAELNNFARISYSNRKLLQSLTGTIFYQEHRVAAGYGAMRERETKSEKEKPAALPL
jgi:transposase